MEIADSRLAFSASSAIFLAMIKAVVMDLGGVLFSEGKTVAIEQLEREHGYEKDAVRKILLSPQSIDLRKGLIGDDEFWHWAQGQLPGGYDARLIKKEWYGGYVLDEDIFQLIKRLKGRYQIIAFSGNVRSRVEFLEERYRFRHLFDKEIYSFDYHRTKPDEKFVQIMIAQSGCRPEEIVYIEDNDPYARPARELGINVLIYCRGEIRKLEKDLQQLGVTFDPGQRGVD